MISCLHPVAKGRKEGSEQVGETRWAQRKQRIWQWFSCHCTSIPTFAFIMVLDQDIFSFYKPFFLRFFFLISCCCFSKNSQSTSIYFLWNCKLKHQDNNQLIWFDLMVFKVRSQKSVEIRACNNLIQFCPRGCYNKLL